MIYALLNVLSGRSQINGCYIAILYVMFRSVLKCLIFHLSFLIESTDKHEVPKNEKLFVSQSMRY